MKIGILTLHYGCNYGGVLQCYALQSYLQSLGHQVEVIDYVPSASRSLCRRIIGKLKTIKSLSDFWHNAADFLKVQAKMQKQTAVEQGQFNEIFDNFRSQYLRLSRHVDEKTIHLLQSQYEAVIVGSDQVWTSLYDRHHIYFLDWLDNHYGGKRLAYAACSAHSAVRGRQRRVLNTLLNRMDAIGVRDIATQSLVVSVNPALQSTIVADPTLLYDFDEFKDCFKPDNPYILTYILGTEIEGGHHKALSQIKAIVGDLPVVSIMVPNVSSGVEKVSDTIIAAATPPQWVSLIRNASAIYTDSFHGIMFSLKFKKVFYAYYANAIRSSRLMDLKQRFPDLPVFQSAPDKVPDLAYNWDGASYIESSKQFVVDKLG